MIQHRDHTDAELVALLNQGDRNAFEIIYKTYVLDLLRYARHIITTKEDCEEIVQDVFEKLWIKHSTLRIQALRPYLIKCVKNKMLNYFEHTSVKKKYEQHYHFFEAVYESVEESDRNDEAVFRIIEQGIENLPANQKRIIQLRLEQNLSSKEIARELDITSGLVNVSIHRTTMHLRALYNSLYKTTL